MTVRELIAELQTLPPELDVYITDDEGWPILLSGPQLFEEPNEWVPDETPPKGPIVVLG